MNSHHKVRELREGFRLKRIEVDEAEILYNMIVEHAKEEDDGLGLLTATLEDYQNAISSSPPAVYGYFIQKAEDNNFSNIGIFIYYFGFSSWKGKKILFLEDLFIHTQYRKLGLGREVMKALSLIAKEEDCPRIDWVVHSSNNNARGFYNRQGAKELKQWILARIDESSLLALQSQ